MIPFLRDLWNRDFIVVDKRFLLICLAVYGLVRLYACGHQAGVRAAFAYINSVQAESK